LLNRIIASLRTTPFDASVDEWERSRAATPRRLDATL
jgi:hypothetical protein